MLKEMLPPDQSMNMNGYNIAVFSLKDEKLVEDYSKALEKLKALIFD